MQILIVEDDSDTRENLRDILELDQHAVSTVGTLLEGLQRIQTGNWDVVILDRKLPDGNAEDFLARYKALACQATYVIITAYADLNGIMSAVRNGVDDYLLKPFNPDLLRKTFSRIATLKDARQQALRAERLAAIGQMTACLTHESRNALQRCQAYLEMLESEVSQNAVALDLVHRARRAQEQLNHLFDEVRGYAAPIVLERTRCNLSQLLLEAWENLSAKRAGREAVLKECGNLPSMTAYVDRFRIVQVFRNLLENSLAASKNDVCIQVSCRPIVLADNTALEICFKDNGPGLSTNQLQHIFEPFYTTKPQGTGLGMAISLRIVEAHGGSLRAENAESGGAQIFLVLPSE